MTQISSITKTIHSALLSISDATYAARLSSYFKTGKGDYGEGDRFIGIRVPELRKLAKQYRDIPIDAAFELLISPLHEQRMLALFILVELYKKASEHEQKKIYTAYLKHTQYINNWDLVDSSAGQIVGAYLFSRDRKPLYKLARSKNLWERRIATIATSFYIARNDFSDALAVAEILLDDVEDLIHKAAGWMLREIGNRDLATEEGFLRKHYKNMPRTMLRYAIEKFPSEKRQAYLKGLW